MVRESKIPVKNFSSIQVSNRSKERLKALALTPRESYENIIIRLLNVKLGGEIIYNISSVHNPDCSVDCVVDWDSDKENIMFFNSFGDRKFIFPKSFDGVDDGDWCRFRDYVLEHMGGLIGNLSVLDLGESIRFGFLVLKRVS